MVCNAFESSIANYIVWCCLFAQSMINDTMVFPETKKINSFSVN